MGSKHKCPQQTMKKQKPMKRIPQIAIAVAMAAAMSVPAFAAAPDDLYVTDGGSTSYGNGFSAQVDYNPEYQEEVNAQPKVESHVVSFHIRTGDKGSLEFDWARVNGRSTLGGANVPGVTLPDGWYLDGYYVNDQKYTAGDLAGYTLTNPTLEVEVRTYPSEQNVGKDDRKETYKILFYVRNGDKGDLTSEQTTVIGYGSKIPYSEIPTLTSRFSSNYSIAGYYVDGVKYSRSDLAKLGITGDLDIEVRTYLDSGSKASGKTSGWKDESDEYDWACDLGVQLKPCGCQYDLCPHTYTYNYGGAIQYSKYGGMYVGGYYYPGNVYASALAGAYPYVNAFATPAFGQCTVTFVPQNGQQALTTSTWGGGLLAAPVTPVCSGYRFLGWSTSPYGKTGYWDFSRDTVNQNLVLYGIWVKNPSTTVTKAATARIPAKETIIDVDLAGYCRVTLKPGNGQEYDPVAVKEGNALRINGNPTCKGYTFVGWAKDEAGEEMWDVSRDKVTSNMTLYGVWEKTRTTNPAI